MEKTLREFSITKHSNDKIFNNTEEKEINLLTPTNILSDEIWNKYGKAFKKDTNCEKHSILPLGVYTVIKTMEGYYLQRIFDNFEFNYKIYGVETDLIDRSLKTYQQTNANLGILLNGLKGTGKTVTAKQICNNLNQPVILITFNDGTVHEYVNNINQNLTILIDEYEKIFEEDVEMLTIMDGAINSEFKRVFILTTNSLRINDNLLQRPGRIRYVKTFQDLSPKIIEELIDDILINKKYKDEVFNFISNLQNITIDIAKSVIVEVNIHDELPEQFKSIFNVKQITGKYDLTVLNPDGKTYDEQYISVFKSVITNFSNYSKEEYEDRRFNLYVQNLGYIYLGETHDGETFTAEINSSELPEKTMEKIKNKLIQSGYLKLNPKSKSKKPLILEVQLQITQTFERHNSFKDYPFAM